MKISARLKRDKRRGLRLFLAAGFGDLPFPVIKLLELAGRNASLSGEGAAKV